MKIADLFSKRAAELPAPLPIDPGVQAALDAAQSTGCELLNHIRGRPAVDHMLTDMFGGEPCAEGEADVRTGMEGRGRG